MTDNNEFPMLQFDFKSDGEETKPVIFQKPRKVITTTQVDEVLDCLGQVQEAITAGYFAAGYMSYEATSAFFPDLSLRKKGKMPLVWFGIFDGPVDEFTSSKIDEITPSKEDIYSHGEWKMNDTEAGYQDNFTEIQKAISAKKIEQVNYTVQFKSEFSGNPYAYYKALSQAQQSDFSAYIQHDDFSILSASPELFFHLKDNRITTRPMKGTIHRGKTYEEDIKNKTWLQTSDKNKYENRLTTALMKEELSDIVDEATLKISKEFAVEKYPTVYQMTSTISGDILPGITIVDIFKQLFPCGSISGTPKLESMEFIADIEKEARDVYCGAIGYITPEQEAVFNVPIRTVVIDHTSKVASYGAGGAITKHSNALEEYKEVLTKSKILHTKRDKFELIETFGLYDGEYIVYRNHLERLTNTAAYFDFTLPLKKIEQQLAKYQNEYAEGNWIIRLLLSESGEFTTEINPIRPFKTNAVTLASKSINKEDIFLYHKTTNREVYQGHRAAFPDFLDTLLWNEDNEITEFTIGNVVIELDGQLLTPPVSSGLLAGTFREELLRRGEIKEQIISLTELEKSSRIWLINSVRKWVEVDLK